MNPKTLALLLAAIIIPGGFIALFGGWILKRAAKTQRGREVLEIARAHGVAFKRKVPGRMTTPALPAPARAA